MQKIVFNNTDGKPKPELAKRYTEIISSSLSELKCPLHEKPVKFELKFNPPDTYLIQVFACCPEFKSTVEKKISLMLS
ncbi:MAG: hypothetical protein KAX05_09535 [Bacteroidales bacterium]|nr:hypothetical protein [Bacteroidales bacterium]